MGVEFYGYFPKCLLGWPVKAIKSIQQNHPLKPDTEGFYNWKRVKVLRDIDGKYK